MDRNTVTGFVLIFAMVIEYQLYFVPAPEPQAEAPTEISDSPQEVESMAEFAQSDNSALDSTYVSKSAFLESDLLKVELTTDGGIPLSAELLDGYLDYWNKQPIRLWNPNSSDMNWIARGEGSYNQNFDLISATSDEVVMKNRGSGPLRTLTYTIDGYLLDVSAEFEDARGEVGFQWQADGAHNEKGRAQGQACRRHKDKTSIKGFRCTCMHSCTCIHMQGMIAVQHAGFVLYNLKLYKA